MADKAYCIRCKQKITFNLHFPYCIICGGGCSSNNRFSATDNVEMFCHLCGEAVYVTAENPLCPECENKTQK
jgi:hypothetical protein